MSHKNQHLAQSATEVAIGELQKEYVVTQEPMYPEVVSEPPMVEVVVGEILGRDFVTQEPAPLEVISEVQDVQFGTSGDKVWTKLPQNFINLDSDNEEHPEEEEILKLTKELSILRIEVRKWRNQVERYQEGMVSLLNIERPSGN